MDKLYGIFKKMSSDNHYVSLTKALNSANTTKETLPTLRRLTGETSHAANLVIHNDVVYTSFIHNYTAHTDDPFHSGSVLELGIFSLERALAEDFDYEKDVEIICFDKNEDIIGDINHTCAFNGNSLSIIGNVLHITLSAQVDGKRFPFFHVSYDTATKTFSKASEIKLLYKGNELPFDDSSVNSIYAKHGYGDGGHGMIQVTSRWSEYEGYYYTAFLIDGGKNNNGVIVRTRDFNTVEFVSVVPENEMGGAEIGSCIFNDNLYVACRQKWTTPYMLFSRLDLKTGEWKKPYCIQDANSRPWMFVYKNELYLYNTLDEAWRRYANISKVRTDKKAHNGKNAPIDTVLTMYGCGAYHSFYVYGERIFFVCSHMGVINFGELKLKLYDAERVNNKLIELFGD